MVILAADTDPIEIVMNIPGKCEEKVIIINIYFKQKNVTYCFVESQAILGRACGIKRPVVAAAII